MKFGWAVSPESVRTRTASRHGRGDRGENIVSPRNFVSGDTIIDGRSGGWVREKCILEHDFGNSGDI